MTTTPTTADLLKYADLQMAAEAFLVNGDNPTTRFTDDEFRQALVNGNAHVSKFTTLQTSRFLEYWEVVAQQPNTATGFSGTLFECISDDPVTGAKKGEKVMSFRSTEFFGDYAKDKIATHSLEIKELGFAWGPHSAPGSVLDSIVHAR